MADKRCENGHFIDESWDLCPYCPADHSEAEIPIVRPTRFGPVDGGPRPVPAPVLAPASAAGSPAAAAAALPTEGRRPTTSAPPAVARREAPAVQAPPMERTVSAPKGEGQPQRYVVGWLIGLNGPARGESFPVRMGRNVLGRDRRSAQPSSCPSWP